MSKTWTNPNDVPAGTIVVGWDGSRHAKSAMTWAVDQARGERRPITVAHVLAPSVAGEVAVWADETQLSQLAASILAEAETFLDEREPRLELGVLVAVGEARHLLVTLSRRAAMVVVGSHGRGPIRSKVLGSVGVAVVRGAASPVVVVRPYRTGIVRRGVLAAVDVDDESATAVAAFGFHQASVLGLPLTVVHGVPEDSSRVIVAQGRRQLSETIAGLRERYPDVHCTPVVQQGSTDDVVLDQAALRHLTAIGAPRRTRKHLTTTASRIIEHATNPVAVVPLGAVAPRGSRAAVPPARAGARP